MKIAQVGFRRDLKTPTRRAAVRQALEEHHQEQPVVTHESLMRGLMTRRISPEEFSVSLRELHPEIDIKPVPYVAHAPEEVSFRDNLPYITANDADLDRDWFEEDDEAWGWESSFPDARIANQR